MFQKFFNVVAELHMLYVIEPKDVEFTTGIIWYNKEQQKQSPLARERRMIKNYNDEHGRGLGALPLS